MAVQGMGRTETCMVHHDRTAVARCAQCHKPACQECVVSTAEGKFCSRDCAAKYESYQKRNRQFKKPARGAAQLVKAVVWLVIIVAGLGAANKYAFQNKMPMIGELLNKLPFFGTEVKRPAPPPTTPPSDTVPYVSAPSVPDPSATTTTVPATK